MELKTASEAAGQSAMEQSVGELAARRRVADADDELRALKYQRARLRRAIAECADSSISTRDIDSNLVTAEEARRVRPRAGDALDNAHQEMLFRLGVERDERSRLCTERSALEAQRESLATAAARAAELKAAVDLQLETVASAAAAIKEPMAAALDSAHSRLSQGELLRLLPSPLYILANGVSSNILGISPGAVMDITGDAAATSQALSNGDGDNASCDAHPLSLKLSLCEGKATITFRYYPSIKVLGAAAEPPAVDAALRHLALGTAAAAASESGGDDAQWPDLSSLLRARRCSKEQSTLDSKVLLPYRPYSWLQWLGGLGPLLTSQPRSSQPVLEALVQSVVAALGGATKQKGRR